MTSITVNGDVEVYLPDIERFIARCTSAERHIIAQRLKRYGGEIQVFETKTLEDDYKVAAFVKAFKHLTSEEIEEKLGARNLI